MKVKCEYCGLRQPYQEVCGKGMFAKGCGALLPLPDHGPVISGNDSVYVEVPIGVAFSTFTYEVPPRYNTYIGNSS